MKKSAFAIALAGFLCLCTIDPLSPPSLRDNSAPVFAGDSAGMSVTIAAGREYSDTLAAADADSDAIAYSFITSHAGMLLNGAVISWEPLIADTGTTPVTVIASDGHGGRDTLRWTVTVIVNHALVIVSTTASMDSLALAGTLYLDTLQATDPDHDPLTFSLAAAVGNMVIVDSIVRWTPSIADTGRHLVTVSVSDGRGGTETLSWNVRVVYVPPNHAPVFTNAAAMNTQAFVGEQYCDTIRAIDADNDTVRYSMINAIAGLSIVDSIISWTPQKTEYGSRTVQLRASDSRGGYDTLQWTIAVGARRPLFATRAGDMRPGARVGAEYRDTLEIVGGAGVVVFEDSVAGMTLLDNIIRLVPHAQDTGLHDIAVVLLNNGSGCDTLHWTIDVAAGNHAPVFITTAADLSAHAIAGVVYRETLRAADPDNDPLTFTLIDESPGMTLVDSVFSWMAAPGDTGDRDVAVVVEDGKGGKDTLSWIIQTTMVNHAPEFSAASGDMPGTAIVGAEYRAALDATDADNDALVFSLLSNIPGMTIVDQTILWTPAIGDTGTVSVRVQVEDGMQGYDTLAWTVLVDISNHAPVFVTTASQLDTTIYYDSLYTVSIETQDRDGDAVAYALISVVSGMTISGNSVIWTPMPGDTGSHLIIAQANDGKGGLDTLSWTIAVTRYNRAPYFTMTPDNTTNSAYVGSAYVEPLYAEDADGDVVTFSIVSGFPGMVISGANLVWTPQAADVGSREVTVMVTDSRGATDTLTWNINVFAQGLGKKRSYSVLKR